MSNANHSRGFPKDVRDFLREQVAAGWTYERTAKCHIRLLPPGGGRAVIMPGTPRQPWLAIRQARRQCERSLEEGKR